MQPLKWCEGFFVSEISAKYDTATDIVKKTGGVRNFYLLPSLCRKQ